MKGNVFEEHFIANGESWEWILDGQNHHLGLQTYQTVAGSVEESGEIGGWPTDRA